PGGRCPAGSPIWSAAESYLGLGAGLVLVAVLGRPRIIELLVGDGLLVVVVGAGLRRGGCVPVAPSVRCAGRTVRDGARSVRVGHRAILGALAGGLPRPGLIASGLTRPGLIGSGLGRRS